MLLVGLVGSLASCKDKEESSDEVPYMPCPCEEKEIWTEPNFSQGETYLFKDSIPVQMIEQINNEIYSEPFPKVCWIVYNSETDDADINIGNLFYPNGSHILSVGSICNFPDFAKEWMIPEKGCKVDIEGAIYEPCNSNGTDNVVYIDYILTSLKRKGI